MVSNEEIIQSKYIRHVCCIFSSDQVSISVLISDSLCYFMNKKTFNAVIKFIILFTNNISKAKFLLLTDKIIKICKIYLNIYKFY